ncbi:MAG TPA: DNA polymerase IV [Solirubrobacteraceae bacterium]|nr:DNA polymerase IV [Solirubrobacteraceae bacterium]
MLSTASEASSETPSEEMLSNETACDRVAVPLAPPVAAGSADNRDADSGGIGMESGERAKLGTCVAHLDADAFYVSVELNRRPELRGLPVVVSGTGPRAVVTTASYEARRFGVGSAMPAARARRLCPQAVFIPPDGAHYREVSKRMMGIVRSHVERVEVVGLDEAYLDLSGLYSPRAAMRRVLADIRAATQLVCSVGIGPNKLVAKVASDAEKPAGFVVLTREQACARFANAPPGLIPGIGPKTVMRLEAMGLRTLGALARASEQLLVERFGPNHGPELRRRAHFEHDGQVSEERKVVSESRERTFDSDIHDPLQLREALVRMAVELCASLSTHGNHGRTIGIKVRLDDFSTVTRARTLSAPTCDVEQVTRVALALLEEYAPARPVRLLGVRVAGLTSLEMPAGTHTAHGKVGQLELPV